jgi:hypothetical protein
MLPYIAYMDPMGIKTKNVGIEVFFHSHVPELWVDHG